MRCPTQWPSRFMLCTLPTKILLYGSMRMLYPFINFLTEDWNLTRDEMGLVLAAGELAGIPGGFLSALGDEFGNRVVGVTSYIVFFVSSLAMLAPPTLAGLICSRVALQLSATVYVIVSQATLVATSAQAKAGWITGISEAGWALSILVLIPILAVAYNNVGWRAPFGITSGLVFLFVLEIYLDYPDERAAKSAARDPAGAIEIPDIAATPRSGSGRFSFRGAEQDPDELDEVAPSASVSASVSANVAAAQSAGTLSPKNGGDRTAGLFAAARRALRRVARSRYWRCLVAPGPLLFNCSALCFNAANNLLFIGFANWAAEEHGLNPEQMGAASVAIGVSELIGSGSVVLFADKFGIYRGLYYSSALMAVILACFTAVSHISLTAGLVSASLAFAPSEYFLVSQIAVVGRFVDADLRTTVTGINFQCHFIGRAIGALIAESLWSTNQLVAVGSTAVAMLVLTFALVYLAHPHLPSEDVEPGSDRASDGSDAQQVEEGGSASQAPQPASASEASEAVPTPVMQVTAT